MHILLGIVTTHFQWQWIISHDTILSCDCLVFESRLAILITATRRRGHFPKRRWTPFMHWLGVTWNFVRLSPKVGDAQQYWWCARFTIWHRTYMWVQSHWCLNTIVDICRDAHLKAPSWIQNGDLYSVVTEICSQVSNRHFRQHC